MTEQNVREEAGVCFNCVDIGKEQCRCGFFSRHGGVSSGHFSTLNIGLGVGDDSQAVATNRDKLKAAMGVEHLLFGHQVHGEEIFVLDEPLTGDRTVDGYDAFITSEPGVGLVIQHADCQPVLLYDPVRQVIGAVHSGWRGSVINLIGRTLMRMTESFGTESSDVQALIGPSLGPCCAEFVHYKEELPETFWVYRDERSHFNFWEISRMQLVEAGVSSEQITLPDVCTSCSPDFFSYRRACRETGGVTGRNGSVIALMSK